MHYLASFIAFVGGLLVGGLIWCSDASAETGQSPVYDQVCMNPAFVNATHGVGMNANVRKCGDAVHPASYGSGADQDRDGTPDSSDPDDTDPTIP